MAPQQPQSQPPASPPDDLEALLVVQAATLLTLEAGSAYASTRALRQVLAVFARSANGRWLMAGAHPTSMTPLPAEQRDRVVGQLLGELKQAEAAVSQLGPVLERGAEQALQIGLRHAAQQIGVPESTVAGELDRIARRLVESTPRAAAAHVRQSQRMIERAVHGLDLQSALGELRRAVDAADTGSRYLTNHVANDAVRQVALARGEQLLWIAERDACVVCLALAGHLADPLEGVGFDEDATYGPYHAPQVWPPGMPLMRPPRHPRCRCQVCIWLGVRSGAPSLPERLKHEAARSVLKGWSRPSESNGVRLRAAQKLLAAGGRGLPKSVQEEAARAVASGRFKSRSVPHYQPKEKHHV